MKFKSFLSLVLISMLLFSCSGDGTENTVEIKKIEGFADFDGMFSEGLAGTYGDEWMAEFTAKKSIKISDESRKKVLNEKELSFHNFGETAPSKIAVSTIQDLYVVHRLPSPKSFKTYVLSNGVTDKFDTYLMTFDSTGVYVDGITLQSYHIRDRNNTTSIYSRVASISPENLQMIIVKEVAPGVSTRLVRYIISEEGKIEESSL